MAQSVISADYIVPRHSGTISITGVKWPVNDGDAVPKGYLSTITSGGLSLTGTDPIVVSTGPGTADISITQADGTIGGYVSGISNTLGGDYTFTGDVNITTSGSFNSYGPTILNELTTTGDTHFSGTVTVEGDTHFYGGNIIFDSTCLITQAADAVVVGDVTVTGDVKYTGDVDISTGNLILGTSSSFTVAGSSVFTGDTTVNGTTVYNGDLYINGSNTSINITEGDIILQGTNSSLQVYAGSQITIAGNSTISGDLVITGDSTVAGDTYFTGSVEVATAPYGDNDHSVANTEFTQRTTRIGSYEASNGWISGGLIYGCLADGTPIGTYPSTDWCFGVSPVILRWTDYTVPTLPSAGEVMTMSSWTYFTVPSVSRTFSSAAIYVCKSSVISNLTPSSSYIHAEFGITTNITKLHGDYIQLGNIVMTPSLGILGYANIKIMPAMRNNLISYDFMTLMTPINVGPMLCSLGGATDLSVVCSGGQLWQICGNVSTSITNPNRVTVPPKSAPELLNPFYQNTSGNIVYSIGTEAPSSQLITNMWNDVGISDLTTVSSTDSLWANTAICYNSSLNFYMQQIPTETFTSSAAAVESVGRFTRIFGPYAETRYLNVIGVVTYPMACTDLTTAVFSRGEFFNYAVGGGYGGGGGTGGGGGGGITALYERNTAFVEQIPGADISAAVGYYNLPFEKLSSALGALAMVSVSTYPGHAHLAAGLHEDASAPLPPYISLAGWGLGTTQIRLISGTTPQDLTASVGVQGLPDARISIRNVRLVDGTGVNLDLVGLEGHDMGSALLVDIFDSEITGPFNFIGRRFGTSTGYTSYDATRFVCLQSCDDITLDGGRHVLNNVFMGDTCTDTTTLTLNATDSDLFAIVIGCYFNNIVVNATGTGTATVKISSSVVTGDIYMNGDNAYITIDRATKSSAGEPIVTGNGTFEIYDEDESQANTIYISQVGSDTGYTKNGTTLNRAVKTLAHAVSLCGAATNGNVYTIKSIDPIVINAAATIPSYVSLDAPNMILSAALTLKGNQTVHVNSINANVLVNTVNIADHINIGADNIYSGCNIIVTSGQCIVESGRIIGSSTSDPILQAYTGCSLVVKSEEILGQIISNGSGAVVDLVLVSNIDNVTWNLTSGGVVRLPPLYSSAINTTSTGILKLTGSLAGEMGIATPGTDYMVGTQNFTAGSDLTGSGILTSPINLTIASHAVKYGQIQQIGANTVIGNIGTASGDCTAVSASTSTSASSIVLRQTDGSASVLHCIEEFYIINKTGGSVSLNSTHPGLIEFYGTDICTCVLPTTAVLPNGYKFTLSNKGASGNVTVNNSTGAAVSTILPNTCVMPICTSSTWEVMPIGNSVSLVGDVLGTWQGTSITTAINTGVVNIANLGTLPAFSVVGNMGTSAASATTVPAYATSTSYSILARDSASNTYTNHMSEAVRVITATAGSFPLYATDGSYIHVIGSSGRTTPFKLPPTSGTGSVLDGFKMSVYNANNATIGMSNSTSTGVADLATIPALGGMFSFICTGGGWISIPQYPNLTITGDLTGTAVGSANMTLSTTIVPSFNLLGTIPAASVIGNGGTSSAVAGTISAVSTSSANSLCIRDAYGSAMFNHLTPSFYTQAASTSGNYTMASTSPTITVITGTGNQTILLPTQGTLTPTGYQFEISNTASGTCTVQNGAGGTISTLLSGMSGRYISLGTSTSSGWITISDRSQVVTISTSANVSVLTGSATTTDGGTGTTGTYVNLFSFNPNIYGSSCAMSVEYNIVVLHSTSSGVCGHLTGEFKAYYAYGSPGTVSVSTPFTRNSKNLDSGLTNCTLTAVNSSGQLIVQVKGESGNILRWSGDGRVVTRCISGTS
jgi:hypothetical protein